MVELKVIVPVSIGYDEDSKTHLNVNMEVKTVKVDERHLGLTRKKLEKVLRAGIKIVAMPEKV